MNFFMKDQKHLPVVKAAGQSKMAVFFSITFIGMFGVVGYLEQPQDVDDATPTPVISQQTPHNVFSKYTSHIPATTAMAIVQNAKRPKTLIAIASVETGKRGRVSTVGDSGKSRGVFQVQPRYWGSAGDDLEAQVKKADWVFDQLVQEHGYHGAVKAFNGTGKKAEQYRNKVYARLEGLK